MEGELQWQGELSLEETATNPTAMRLPDVMRELWPQKFPSGSSSRKLVRKGLVVVAQGDAGSWVRGTCDSRVQAPDRIGVLQRWEALAVEETLARVPEGIEVYPPLTWEEPNLYQLGDEVFVLKKGRPFARGHITEELQQSPGHPHQGRCGVGYSDGTTYHVRAPQLVKVHRACTEGQPAKVVVTRETDAFRRMARTQVRECDKVLDIGSHLGHSTANMAAECPHVIGLDKCAEYVHQARLNYPELRFEVVDVLADGATMHQLGAGCTKIFFDINGTRELSTVLSLLAIIQRNVHPDLIVIKSKHLYDNVAASVR